MLKSRSLGCDIPAPSFDAAALDAYLDIVGDPTPIIRRGLAAITPAVWRDGIDGIIGVFGIDHDHHCFHVGPHDWATFHEPQITAGFVHFLNSGDHSRRLARSIAFVQAASRCAGNLLNLTDIRSARCVAEENRTDILVELQGGQQLIGASIEAKFGHKLTRGQLPKSYRHVCTRSWDLTNSVLLVVAPDPATLNAAVMRQNRKAGWRATSWWALLGHLERLTDPAHDCSDYRRFRRTVWARAY